MKRNKFIAAGALALALILTTTSLTPLQALTTVEAQAAAVKLNKKTASVTVGKTVQLKLSGAKKVTWKSSNKKVASVSSTGLVKGLKNGTCVITATNKVTKKTYKCTITVKKATPTIKVTSDLKRVDTITNGDGKKFNLYEVDLENFTSAWVKRHFKVTTTPANTKYTISYMDVETNKEYTTIPTEGGCYAVIFNTGKVSAAVWVDVMDDSSSTIKITSDLTPSRTATNGDGTTFDVYQVNVKDWNASWINQHFQVSVTPADTGYEMIVSDLESGEEFDEIPAKEGAYALAFVTEEGLSAGQWPDHTWAAVWIIVNDEEETATGLEVTSDLKPIKQMTNGDGITFDVYEASPSEFSESWIRQHFNVTTTPAGVKYDIRYADRTGGRGKGYYYVIFYSGKVAKTIWVDALEQSAGSLVSDMNVTSDLTPYRTMTNGEGNTFDVYKVSPDAFSESWIRQHFTVTTTPAGAEVDITYADRTGGNETGFYYVLFRAGNMTKAIWVDAVK